LDLVYAVCRKIQNDDDVNTQLCALFVENYNVSKAEMLIPAADLSEQISTAGWEASGTGNMKFAMNGALTIGTPDGANLEMQDAVGDRWWPFRFGASAQENLLPYHPSDIYEKNTAIQKALNTLIDGTLATDAHETTAFAQIHKYLTQSDPYRVLKDLPSYYETQKQVEALFLHPNLWAETAIQNIAGMSPFSTDASIRSYAEKIWEIEPCPPDLEVLEKVRSEYSEHDQCRIH
jgi:starch phosphorylase